MKACRTEYRSPIGTLTLASDGKALLGLWIEGQQHWGGNLCLDKHCPDPPLFQQAFDWLDRYFNGARPNPEALPLAPTGNAFQHAVWKSLCRIGYGTTASYGDIAMRLGTSPRAVGSAVSRNPISIIIPCHRVIGSDGRITGYAGGIERKEWLLKHEKSQTPLSHHMPTDAND